LFFPWTLTFSNMSAQLLFYIEFWVFPGQPPNFSCLRRRSFRFPGPRSLMSLLMIFLPLWLLFSFFPWPPRPGLYTFFLLHIDGFVNSHFSFQSFFFVRLGVFCGPPIPRFLTVQCVQKKIKTWLLKKQLFIFQMFTYNSFYYRFSVAREFFRPLCLDRPALGSVQILFPSLFPCPGASRLFPSTVRGLISFFLCLCFPGLVISIFSTLSTWL